MRSVERAKKLPMKKSWNMRCQLIDLKSCVVIHTNFTILVFLVKCCYIYYAHISTFKDAILLFRIPNSVSSSNFVNFFFLKIIPTTEVKYVLPIA